MKQFIATACMAGALFLPASGALAADTVKLSHLLSIYSDEKNGDIKHPEGIACSDKNQFVVADSGNGRLVRFLVKEDGIAGGVEIKIPQLLYPIRLQYGPGGEILALDGKQRRIVRIAPDGSFAGYLEFKGVPGEGAIIPRSFRVDTAGAVYLLDIFGERVIQLDPAGNFQRQILFPAGYSFCSDLAVDGRGGIILLDSVRAMLYSVARDGAAFTPLTGELHEYCSFPAAITLDSRGAIYLSDRNDGGVVIIGPDGSFQRRQLNIGQKNGFLLYPGQICFDSRDTLFVADTANSRVQLFNSGK